MKAPFLAAACALAVFSPPKAGRCDEPSCAPAITRRNLAACALAASLSLREQLAEQRAAEARRESARLVLPSNPTLAGFLAARSRPGDQALNWSVSLAQELEVGAQRGLRIEVADGELKAEVHRLAASRRDVAARAWSAYFEVLAARERHQLALRLDQATSTVADTVRAMSSHGLASEVDADLALAAALRASHERLLLESALSSSTALLELLLGAAPGLAIDGALEPLALTLAGGLSSVPELDALEAKHAAAERKIDLLARGRIPNPTVSLQAQTDGFDERVLGAGLSFPLPLPQPLGRTQAREIAEARANSERIGLELERAARERQTEQRIAAAELEAASKARQLYPPAAMEHALTRLDGIAAQVKAARLPVREALVAQQALVEQLKWGIDAREALCLASVRYARLNGISLEGGDR